MVWYYGYKNRNIKQKGMQRLRHFLKNMRHVEKYNTNVAWKWGGRGGGRG